METIIYIIVRILCILAGAAIGFILAYILWYYIIEKILNKYWG